MAEFYRHIKRGSVYERIEGVASVQSIKPVTEGDLLVVYRGVLDRKLWARPVGEFNDGRFEKIGEIPPVPIDMILFCPNCGKQHIDAPEPCTMGWGCREAGVCYAEANNQPERCDAWNNPPHKSHKCKGCGHVWRPADVHTNGVETIKSTGEKDSPKITGHAFAAIGIDDGSTTGTGSIGERE